MYLCPANKIGILNVKAGQLPEVVKEGLALFIANFFKTLHSTSTRGIIHFFSSYLNGDDTFSYPGSPKQPADSIKRTVRLVVDRYSLPVFLSLFLFVFFQASTFLFRFLLGVLSGDELEEASEAAAEEGPGVAIFAIKLEHMVARTLANDVNKNELF